MRKLNLKISFRAMHENKYTEMPFPGQHERELNPPCIDKDLSTKWIQRRKSQTTKSSSTDKLRLGISCLETVYHIISGCTVFAENEYIKRKLLKTEVVKKE